MPGRAAEGPEQQALIEVRRRFFRLHKTLIDAERLVYERQQRRALGSGEFLQALIQDAFFAWLRPFSGLIVEMDEALATREPLAPAEVEDFLQRVERLTRDDGAEASERYPQLCAREPNVLLAHIEIRAALEASR